MLEIITGPQHPYYSWIQTDPVRPEIPVARRVDTDCSVFALGSGTEPWAILCCRYMQSAPDSVDALFQDPDLPSCAVFYSIWSLVPGHARSLIIQARDWILQNRPEVCEFITLSPPTDMARDFHLRNGASVYRINKETVNYYYEPRT